MITPAQTTRGTYKAFILRTVSRGVLLGALVRLEAEAEHGASAPTPPVLTSPALTPSRIWVSLLAHMRLWLSLIFNPSGMADVSASLQCDEDAPLNRSAARARKRTIPTAHASYALGHILMRRHGYARFIQWLYDFGLIGRVRFCFLTRRGLYWGLLWARAKTVAIYGQRPKIAVLCAAPLWPD